MPNKSASNSTQSCLSWLFQFTGFLADVYYLSESFRFHSEPVVRHFILISFQFPQTFYPFLMFAGNVWVSSFIWRVVFSRYLGQFESFFVGIILTTTGTILNAAAYGLVVDNWMLIFHPVFVFVFISCVCDIFIICNYGRYYQFLNDSL